MSEPSTQTVSSSSSVPFRLTEPEVAGSDPTGIQTHAEEVEGGWVINGHKWFTSGARGANFAIVIACTDPDSKARGSRPAWASH